LINKYSNIPIYSQLKDLIIYKIKNGEYAQDQRIPSEQEFCELYGISRPTVRQAIAELTNNGYLYKSKGKGTFVARPRACIDIKNYMGFTDSILDSKEPALKDIISMDILDGKLNKKLADTFGKFQPDFPGRDFIEIKYLSAQENEVLSLNVSYLPLTIFPNIEEDIKAKKPSYDILKGKYPYIPFKAKSTLEVSYTDQDDAKYLRIQTGLPLIKIENVLYSKSGQAVEYIVSKYRTDRCRFIFENTK